VVEVIPTDKPGRIRDGDKIVKTGADCVCCTDDIEADTNNRNVFVVENH